MTQPAAARPLPGFYAHLSCGALRISSLTQGSGWVCKTSPNRLAAAPIAPWCCHRLCNSRSSAASTWSVAGMTTSAPTSSSLAS